MSEKRWGRKGSRGSVEVLRRLGMFERSEEINECEKRKCKRDREKEG